MSTGVIISLLIPAAVAASGIGLMVVVCRNTDSIGRRLFGRAWDA